MAKKKNSRPQPKKTGSIPPALDTPEFVAVWSEWQRFTADRGIELTTDDSERQLTLLAKLSPDEAIAEVRQTMAEHPLKGLGTAKDHASGRRQTKTNSGRKSGAKAAPKAEAEVKEPATAPQEATAKAKRRPRVEKIKRPSALDAAAKVLGEKGEPMTCKEMIEAMATKRYWQSPNGATPEATLYSAMLREMKVKENEARFEKVARGQFKLRAK